jgi:hypothetical protein
MNLWCRLLRSYNYAYSSFIPWQILGIMVDVDKEEKMFICEYDTLYQLVSGLMLKCQCGKMDWIVSSLRQIGHVVRIQISCKNCSFKKWWASSRVCCARYFVNQKSVSW